MLAHQDGHELVLLIDPANNTRDLDELHFQAHQGRTCTTEATPPRNRGVEEVVAMEAVILPLSATSSPNLAHVDIPHDATTAQSAQFPQHQGKGSPHSEAERLKVPNLPNKLRFIYLHPIPSHQPTFFKEWSHDLTLEPYRAQLRSCSHLPTSFDMISSLSS